MTGIASKAYTFAVYSQGRYTLLLVGLSVFTLPILNMELLMGPSLVLTVLGLALGLVLTKPAWQPEFLRAPRGFVKCLGAMLASSVIFLIAMALGYAAIINMGLGEPLSRDIAILTALPTLALTGVMWWSALGLIAAGPSARRGTPVKRPQPDPTPIAERPDMRSIRKSRMA